VLACSAIDVKARAGKASIINFKELPEGIAGVIPMIFRFFWLGLKWLSQKHPDIGGRFSSDFR
jgi:hypothetical protein